MHVQGASLKTGAAFPKVGFSTPRLRRGGRSVDASVGRAEAISLKSYTYKVGAKGAWMGGVFVVGCFLMSRTMLSDDTE